MNWEPIKKRLSTILNTDVTIKYLPQSTWNTNSFVFEIDEEVMFLLETNEQQLTVFSVPQIFMTGSEKSLVELLIQQYKHLYLSDPANEQPSWQRIRTWILRQLDNHNTSVVLPETLFPSERLNVKWVPLFLQFDFTNTQFAQDFAELNNLLDSFFDVETILIPLRENQWFVLASVTLLLDSEDDVVGDSWLQSAEEVGVLESLGYGLYEMLANEWMGTCLLSIGRPIDPRTDMIRAIHELQQTVSLGRKYRQEKHLYFPWRMRLERLLEQIDDDHIVRFLDQTLKLKIVNTIDTETIHTLEQFFENDCNVSETAKKLYIHRNTLLYRLDKFKQETEMDVRNFHQAVLVRIALLLYKVTKH